MEENAFSFLKNTTSHLQRLSANQGQISRATVSSQSLATCSWIMILPHPDSHRTLSCTPPFLSLIIIFIEVHQDPECTQPNSHFLFHLLVIRNTSNNVDLITSLIDCLCPDEISQREKRRHFHGRGIGEDADSKSVQKLLLKRCRPLQQYPGFRTNVP